MASGVRTFKTSLLLNPPKEAAQRRTYVILGTERGGTSVVAGAVRAMGIYLGDVPEGNNEDPRFKNAPLKEMRNSIDLRNSSHDVWGWKYPTAVNYLPIMMKWLRRPHFIVMYRDPVATTLSRIQWDGGFLQRPPKVALHEATSLANANTTFAMSAGRPCLLISNEKATRHREALIDEVAAFLRVPTPEGSFRERLLAYCEPGSYKDFNEFFPEVPVLGDPEHRAVEPQNASSSVRPQTREGDN